ncbi:MAG: ATP-binding protein [Gemmatimonadota bacterium]
MDTIDPLTALDSDDSFNATLLRALLQQMPSGALVAEVPSGRILLTNQQLEQVWRQPLPPAGVHGVSTVRGFHQDGRPYDLEEWPLSRVLRTGEAVEGEEIEIVRGDGTHAIVRVSALPLREKGRVVAVLVTYLDVSVQRRRYASQKFLAGAGAVLSGRLDPVTTLGNIARFAVPTLADWCAIDLLDDAGGIERVAVEHVDQRKARAAAALARRHPPRADVDVGVARVIRSGRPELIAEVTPETLQALSVSPPHRRLLEELGIRSVMIVPLIGRGDPLGAITLVAAESGRLYTPEDLEIAEELAARAALAIENSRLYDKSEAASAAKSDFLAVMSHELRTPLTAIIGYAELLQMGVPEAVTPGQRDQAERIEVSARHLLQLIEEILTLVTLDTGELRLRDEAVSVRDLLDRAVSIIEPMAKAKGLPLDVRYPTTDTTVRSDPDKLLQIVLNLLSNAVKFTESGEIRLAASQDGSWLTVEVADTGIGMDPEHIERIYEPFWQVERPITRRAGGTGLGLTISRRLADLLGAEIEVESEVGRGSTFRLRMPAR